ncbi:MAG TPA: 16S rRNA (cytidine(1402)-2'-O)-methyltransferase [Solirubrobacteraceae bacterium]|jgi:16S rRNA (cytidine1402-2'-O)-methyltransferase|nr:16S rRNA (cytidine(1402)-2'-O)-methyltransferase [Solirubrobacteraceae bacterium]
MPSRRAPTGRLVVCPTPIGNLEDVTLRVLDVLARADVVACEDTRHTRKLLDRHGIRAELTSFHEHNERSRTPELVRRIGDGALVALVSDAGTPLISDPGFELVRRCREQGVAVEVLPGASAAVTALVASGLPAERWCFAGFLPRTRGERLELLGGTTVTLVAYESPRRLPGTLRELAEVDPERPVAVARELTKVHEEVRSGTARDLAEHFAAEPPRGEVVLVCGAAAAGAPDRSRALAAVADLVQAGARPRAAAGAVARLTGVPANELYRALTDG